MSLTHFSEAGSALDKVLREHAEGIEDGRARLKDQQTQLGVMNISLLSVRAEVLSRIDDMEAKVLTAIAGLSRHLGTNGSGGDHG